jgi:mxaA protein
LLHRALDVAFGRVLIGADLPQFLAARPEFRPLADRLAAFFAASDAAFFGQHARPDTAEAQALARDLARIERGRR